MKVVLHGPEHLELNAFGAPGFVVDAHDPAVHFSALEMFATSLGLCTYSVLASYAEQAGLDAAAIAIDLRWSYSEAAPIRVERVRVGIRWPGLPRSRVAAARRAAAHCTLHNTLAGSTEVVTEVSAD